MLCLVGGGSRSPHTSHGEEIPIPSETSTSHSEPYPHEPA